MKSRRNGHPQHHIHIDTERLERAIDAQQQTLPSISRPHLPPQHSLFSPSTRPSYDRSSNVEDAQPPPAPTLTRSTFSSSFLKSILSTLAFSTSIFSSTTAAPAERVPTSGLAVTEPPLSPRSMAAADAVAYPFTRAPAVYSVPFIIDDQICIVPYVPLPIPPRRPVSGYAAPSITDASSPSQANGRSPFAPHTPSPTSSPRSPYSPPSPASPSLSALYPASALSLGSHWLSLLSPNPLSSRFHPNLYPKLLHTASLYSAHITKDIARTFPSHPLFQQRKTRQQLFNVLKAYSVYDLDIGYSQGMAFLVGCLMLHVQDEEAVFWCFVTLMYSPAYSLRSLYFDDCVSLKRLLLLTQRCLDEEQPALRRLSAHLRALQLDVTLFATQWLVTVYAYRFSAPFTERVWTAFLERGWAVLLQVALAVMEWMQERVVGLSFEAVMPVVSSMYDLPVDVVDRSARVHLSEDVCDELERCKVSVKRVRTLKM